MARVLVPTVQTPVTSIIFEYGISHSQNSKRRWLVTSYFTYLSFFVSLSMTDRTANFKHRLIKSTFSALAILSVGMSVRPSVRHTRDPRINGSRCQNTVCLKKTSPTFLAVTLESIVRFS